MDGLLQRLALRSHHDARGGSVEEFDIVVRVALLEVAAEPAPNLVHDDQEHVLRATELEFLVLTLPEFELRHVGSGDDQDRTKRLLNLPAQPIWPTVEDHAPLLDDLVEQRVVLLLFEGRDHDLHLGHALLDLLEERRPGSTGEGLGLAHERAHERAG